MMQVAKECQRECRRSAMLSQKTMKDAVTRARRLSKEMQAYWKRFDKVEKEHRRKAEKEAMEQRKMDIEFREVTCYVHTLKYKFMHNNPSIQQQRTLIQVMLLSISYII